MPRPRFQKLPYDRREQMLEVAAKEFAQHGYDGASLNHILAAAGVSKGAAYYYFDDKADLFVTVVRHYWDHIQSHTSAPLTASDGQQFWPHLMELYRHGVAHLKESPWMLGVARSVWRLSKEARGQKTLGALFDLSQEWLASFVRRGQEAGAIRTDLPTDLLIALIVGLDGAWDHWFLENLDKLSAAELERIVAALLTAVRALLSPPAGGP